MTHYLLLHTLIARLTDAQLEAGINALQGNPVNITSEDRAALLHYAQGLEMLHLQGSAQRLKLHLHKRTLMPKLISYDGQHITYSMNDSVLIPPIHPTKPVTVDHQQHHEVNNKYKDSNLYVDNSIIDTTLYGEPVFTDENHKLYLGGDVFLEHDDGSREPFRYPTPVFTSKLGAALKIATWLTDLQHDVFSDEEQARIRSRILKLAENQKVDATVKNIYEALGQPL